MWRNRLGHICVNEFILGESSLGGSPLIVNMGRARQRNRIRNKPSGNTANQQQNRPYHEYTPGEKQAYKLQQKSNKEFEAYYQAQGIVPEGEWESFMEALRSPLPTTFRITGFKKQSRELLKLVKGEYLDKLVNVEIEGRVIKPPKCLSWYPDEFAWQLDMDRKFIRTCNPLKKLHQFLIEETASGNISRQEAVSMIPPLVIDVQPHHKVLDMCAAPGSKTAQLVEMLHNCDEPVPEGCVVANDSDNKRCYVMIHQLKRLESASFVIINQDASNMPNFKVPDEKGLLRPVRFDRVLADVPCSGDGTMRKSPDAWGKWNVHTGMHLHNIQSRILSRGLEMLDVGGRLVYSTCSLNPIEDEAVVSNLLRRSQGAVRLITIATALPGLKAQPGMSSWKIMSRDMVTYDSPDELPQKLKSTIRPSVFPPSADEAEIFNLNRCLRILPHHQDTGGFFISLLEKTDELPWVKKSNTSKNAYKPKTEETNQSTENTTQAEGENEENTSQSDGENLENMTQSEGENGDIIEKTDGTETEEKDGDDIAEGGEGTEPTTDMDRATTSNNKRPFERSRSPQSKRRRTGYKEDPFIFLNDQDPIWPPIRDFFKLEGFPVDQLLVRCKEGKKRNIYFASRIVKDLVNHNIDRLKFVNLGLKILSRSDSPYVTCPFRTVQEGVAVLYPHVRDRIVSLTKDDIVTLLSTEMPFLVRFSKDMQAGLGKHNLSTGQGSVIFVYDPTKDDRPDSPKCDLVLCGWLGRTSCRSFIAMNERGHYLRLCGSELKTKGEKPQKDRLTPEKKDPGQSPDEVLEGSEEFEIKVNDGSGDKVMDESEVTDESGAKFMDESVAKVMDKSEVKDDSKVKDGAEITVVKSDESTLEENIT